MRRDLGKLEYVKLRDLVQTDQGQTIFFVEPDSFMWPVDGAIAMVKEGELERYILRLSNYPDMDIFDEESVSHWIGDHDDITYDVLDDHEH